MSDSVRVPRPPIGTFEAANAVELAVAERSGFVENRHVGSAVVLGQDGERVLAVGDPDSLVLPRSTMKPFQAVASIGAGAALDPEQTAIATASHAGTAEHVALVRGILGGIGMDASALRCPAALPADREAREQMLRSGGSASPVFMECSGKHAAMLAACAANGWTTADYTDPRHPLQQHVKDVVERLTGEKIAHTAVDGCGAPVFAISLTGLARGIHRMASASEQSPFALYRNAAHVHRSAREHPWAISGHGRPDTVLMETLGGYAKAGADGVMTMSTADGATVAVKVLDGSVPAARVSAVALLAAAGALDKASAADALERMDTTIPGGGAPVGRMRPVV
ncbi:asparaginase [Planctomonas sp. JC2975]|uniref:asparaginase n=1 Tax=Planctomonas sp. JC2975 TaxID=2729626 RepID=UPI001473EDDE|nr:asparaginase [Planctomonas sp. JC2975]NNC13224.1 asparaginase [Planctomonas sp. JC2975]